MADDLTATRSRRGGNSGRRAQRAAEAAVAAPPSDSEEVTVARGDVAVDETSAASTVADCSAAWVEFCASDAKVHSANLQLRHLLGKLDGISIGQVETLQEVMRRLCLELEECRVRLARAQERELVEARIAHDLERKGTLPRGAIEAYGSIAAAAAASSSSGGDTRAIEAYGSIAAAAAASSSGGDRAAAGLEREALADARLQNEFAVARAALGALAGRAQPSAGGAGAEAGSAALDSSGG